MLSSKKGFSGIHNPIYQELNKIFDISLILDPFAVPLYRKINSMLKTFHPNKSEWSHRYHQALDTSKVSSSAFDERTKYCNSKIAKFSGTYDFIFQLSSMFMLTNLPSIKPYFIYIDRTPKMTEKLYPKLFSHLSIEEKTQLNKFNELAFKRANEIFTFNDIVKISLQNDYGISPDKVFSVSSGVNVTELQECQEAKSKLVITVCSDYYRHGGQLCIDAFHLASKELPDVKFMFIGENLSKAKVNFDSVGYLPYNELKKIYSMASISLMLSPLGGFQTITDSMAHKCVCLALNNNPYIQNVIKHGENGFLVNDNPEEISKTIINICNDNFKITKKIGNEAYKYILLNCTWKNVAEKISNHIIKYLSL